MCAIKNYNNVFFSSKGGNFVINSLIECLKYEDLFKNLSSDSITMGKKVYQIDLAKR